jgi:hypothetical protein
MGSKVYGCFLNKFLFGTFLDMKKILTNFGVEATWRFCSWIELTHVYFCVGPPRERTRLQLVKRTVEEGGSPAVVASSSSNPFGSAKPVDTAKKEMEIDNKIEKVSFTGVPRDGGDERPPSAEDRPAPKKTGGSNPFGSAKPVDTAKKEKEIDDKLEKVSFTGAPRDRDGDAPRDRDGGAPRDRDSGGPRDRDGSAPRDRDSGGLRDRDAKDRDGGDERPPSAEDKPAPPKRSGGSNPFGGAKPVDTAKKEKEIDDKLEKVSFTGAPRDRDGDAPRDRDSGAPRDRDDGAPRDRDAKDRDGGAERPPSAEDKPAPPKRSGGSNPFGGAKPVDTAKKEKEIDDKLEKVSFTGTPRDRDADVPRDRDGGAPRDRDGGAPRDRDSKDRDGGNERPPSAEDKPAPPKRSSSNPFGAAKPVDTLAKEKEIEERLIKQRAGSEAEKSKDGDG